MPMLKQICLGGFIYVKAAGTSRTFPSFDRF